MAICPATRQPCIDDLCYGSGCMKDPFIGEPMLIECRGCKQLIAKDGSDSEDCECDSICDSLDDEDYEEQ